MRHALALERFGSGEVDAIVRLLNERVVPDLLAQIERRLGRMGARGSRAEKRLRALLASTRAVIGTGLRFASGRLRRDLEALAISEARWQAAMLRAAAPVAIDFVTPSPQTLRSVVTSRPMQGRFLRDWFADLGRSAQRRVSQQVSIGLVQGESIPAIVRRLRGTRAGGFADGAIHATRREAAMIARTAVNHVVTQAREATYRDNAGVIKGVMWVSTLDARTTPICQSLDGKVFGIDEGPRPPAHENCRSTTVPVLKSWRELGIDLDEAPGGTRASMDGQVPATLTYSQWLRKQPKEVQDEALGPTRARLWRSNQVTIDRFVGGDGRTLTLEELMRIEGLSEEAVRVERD